MKEGFYEKILTEALARALEEESDKTILLESFNKTDGSVFIQRYLQDVLRRAFNQLAEARDDLAKKQLIDFSNELIKLIATFLKDSELRDDAITSNGEILKAFFCKSTYTQVSLEDHIKDIFPITGLSESALFNGSKHTPSLESELS